MSYEKLLDDLETLQKSYAAGEDDQKIQAAAADGEKASKEESDDEDEKDADGNPIKADPDDEKADDKPAFAKSFKGTTEDGESFEAVDGTEMIKALNTRVDAFIDNAQENETTLTKSLTAFAEIAKAQDAMIKTQSEMIKSLHERVEALANSGSGRRSVSAPSADMAKSLAEGAPLNPQTFMLKANAAYDAGRLSGKELTICDVSMRHGSAIDDAIVSKVLAG